LWPSWARYVKDKHISRFAQFAVNVMGVANDFAHPDETAEKGIRAIEEFYHKIGMPINIHELLGREITDAEIDIMVDKCSRGGTLTLGGIEILKAEDMRAIYNMAR
jgi:alcohol dehydrogenase YqhD (iron-dependent ADH family)